MPYMSEECVFCRIGKKEIPSHFLYQDDRTFVIKDINPKAPVHLLVMPFEHVTYLEFFTEDQKDLLGHLVIVARDMASHEGLIESGYRLAINQKDDSGQEVPHLHLHVLGGQPLGAIG
tara:strand:- start:112 stop:465 length:354 start_codon:yes stop_codon:yes gene_type:complete